MRNSHVRKAIWLLGLVAVLVLSTATVTASPAAQEDGSPGTDDVTPVPPLEPLVAPPPAEGEAATVDAAGPMAIAAAPSAQMNYQGYLTDTAGQPLNGVYDMTFRLFNDPTAGTKRWGDELHADVTVSKGLFQVVLGETVPILVPGFSSPLLEQLYLEVQVEATVMPRQPLRAVPYAMGLVVGAHVKGNTTAAADYGFAVDNEGGRGIYTNAKDDGGYGLFNADVTYSDEGYAGPDTYIWVPAMNARVKQLDVTTAHVEVNTFGEVAIESDSPVANIVDVEIPVQVEQPYGRKQRLELATVYYSTDNPNAYIDVTWLLGRDFNTGATQEIGVDNTAHTATTYSSYSLAPTGDYDITNLQALTNLQVRIRMANADGTVHLYGVRLRLSSNW